MEKINPFEPVRIKSILASEQIYNHIKEAIINGELTAEERLTETKLAEWLQVSRTPLREALQRLELEKWLTRIPGGGLKVLELEKEKIKQIFQVRAVLEGLLAREVTLKLTESDIEKIMEFTDEMRENIMEKNEKFVKSADKVHELLTNKSENTIAKDMLILINDQIRYCRKRVIKSVKGLPENAYEEHLEINEALIRRDPIEAEKVMRRHFENAGDRLLTSIEKQGNSE